MAGKLEIIKFIDGSVITKKKEEFNIVSIKFRFVYSKKRKKLKQTIYDSAQTKKRGLFFFIFLSRVPSI